MAGTAADLGQATLAGALTGILSALGGSSAGDPAIAPVPIAPPQPQRVGAGMIAGVSVGTLALVGVAILLFVKLAK